MQQRRWHIHPDTDKLQQTVAEHIVAAANAAIQARGAFHIVLAGGRTPAAVYERLIKADTDWNFWFIYYGDERCLDPDSAERNDSMVRARWLEQVPIPAMHVYSIPAELGPEPAAAFYSGLLAPVGTFDLV
jgi:6-phosphogluconolactonase